MSGTKSISMRKQILVFILSATCFSCQNSESNKQADKNSYELSKENLLMKEKKNPENFLTVSGHDKRNLLGQTVVKGSVLNKATVASYKDVDLKLEFYSKTGTLLETDHEIVYEVIPPGQSKNFKTKYFAPKGTDSVALKVVSAKLGM